MSTKKVLLIVFSILIVSCSTKTYVISSAYEGREISNMVMFIPNLEKCRALDKGNIFNEAEINYLEEKCLKQFNTLFGNLLHSNSTFRQVYSIKFKNPPEYDKKILPVNKDENISLVLPTKSIKLDTTEETYILHIENFGITIYEESLDTSDPAKHYSVSAPSPGGLVLSPLKFIGQYFLITFHYAIYENNSLELVCYGKMNLKDKFAREIDFDKALGTAFNKVAQKLLKNTPFEK